MLQLNLVLLLEVQELKLIYHYPTLPFHFPYRLDKEEYDSEHILNSKHESIIFSHPPKHL